MPSTDYNATVTFEIKAKEEHGNHLVEELRDFSPAVGPDLRGRLEIVLTVHSVSVHAAAMTAIALAERAVGKPAADIEVMTTAEFDRRVAEPLEFPPVIGVADAAEVIGVARQRVQQLVELGELQHQKAGNTTVLLEQEVRSYAAVHKAKQREKAEARRVAEEGS